MSGIAGIINLDGAPVDRELLQHMTDFMAYRGPDAQEVWIDGSVGFGHAMLRTTYESEREKQPCTLDGQVWITADARVDARTELKQKLAAKGRQDVNSATDVELILHAYYVWGEDCVKHLLGDFAFAIWDGRQKRLFCARDHFGIRQFFYGLVAQRFIFSNTLNCVRQHPTVTAELNEQAIADFLLFDANQDLATSAFVDIQRLPPAHYLVYSPAGLSIHRYWTVPNGKPLVYQQKRDYIEHFLELLREAVADRLRTDRVSILMSGGLDSTAVAAIAHELLAQQSSSFELQAHTVVFDRLFPDQERYYAGLVAESLQIPIRFLVADDYLPWEDWDISELRQLEPVNNPFLKASFDLTRQVAVQHRVALTGSDGDTFFFELSHPYFSDLLKRFRFGRFLADSVRYMWNQGELPRVGLRARLRRWRGKQWQPEYPAWLNPDFAARLQLPEHWAEHLREQPLHPLRPKIYRVLNAPMWSQHFEQDDANVTGLPVEYRNPFADLRLLEFSLSLPAVPWLIKKELLRQAMRGILPGPVCNRPKSPLADDRLRVQLRDRRTQWIDRFAAVPEMKKYVRREAIPPCMGEPDSHRLWMNIRPLTLNCWLAALTPAPYQFIKEESHETRDFEPIGWAAQN